MTTDQQILDAILPIISAARAIDDRITTACVSIGITDEKVFIKFYGDDVRLDGGYGVNSVLSSVKKPDPLAEKQAEIERLKNEVAEIERKIAEKTT